MPTLISTARHGRVAVLLIDNPPVNALADGVPEALSHALDDVEQDPGVAAIVIGAAGRTFVAGADINLLEETAWGNRAAKPELKPLLNRIERSAKPVVMAIHGTALGGGLELALAGHYRIALTSAQVGLPEVNLGIIPGADGTQRLPRLTGVKKALEMVVSGRPIGAREALDAGIIDRVVEDDLLGAAIAFAGEVADRATHPRTSERTDRLEADTTAAVADATALAAKIRAKQTAPLRVIEAVALAATLPFADGSAREDEIFDDNVTSEQAKAMIHVFFAERATTKLPDLPQGLVPAPVDTVAIIGAGTMGSGIAMACANAGLRVILLDEQGAALDRGLGSIRRNYDTSVKRGRMSDADVAERLGRIQPQTGLDGVAGADVIVEAVYQDLALKQSIFGALDRLAKLGVVLGTNTSTLDLDAIAHTTSRPGAVIGLHFFSPANVMRLVEVVRGRDTHAQTIATAVAFAKRIGKLPVVVRNGPGFAGNRMMFPYMYETQFLVEDGSTPEEVDRALTDFGMAMGMFAVDDMAGIDVAQRVRREMRHFAGTSARAPLVQTKLYEMGRLGQKTGKGWYRYGDDWRPQPDPEVIDLIRATARAAGIAQRTHTPQEIVERCLYAMINEGARVLADGIAMRASDLDVIYVNGYGFPAWRGGPMFWADRVGLAAILERIRAFHREFGDRWTPAPLLERVVREGRTFRDLDRTPARLT